MDFDVNWQCPLCTLVNSKVLGSCDACNTRRPDSPDDAPILYKGVPDGASMDDMKKVKDDLAKKREGEVALREKSQKTNGHVNHVRKSSSNEDVKVTLKNHVSEIKNNIKRSLSLNTNVQNKTKPVSKVQPNVVDERGAKAALSRTRSTPQKKTDAKVAVKDTVKSNRNSQNGPVAKSSSGKSGGSVPTNSYKWLCPSVTCKHENENYLDSCIVCHKERPADVVYIKDEMPDEKADSDKISDKTDNNKDKTNGEIETQLKEWSCKRCTLKNPVEKTKCSVCESPRVSSIPTPESIPIDLDYSKFPPSVSPVSPTRKTPTAQKSFGKGISDTDEWTCGSCTFKCNPSFAKICEKCGKGKRPAANVSDSPSTQPQGNIDARPKIPPRNSQKQTSDTKKPTLPRRVPLPKGPVKKGPPPQIPKPPRTKKQKPWVCVLCTYENPANANICNVCSKDKSVAEKGVDNTWVCVTCTLVNKQDVAVCEVCGTVKTEGLTPKEASNETKPDKNPEPSDSKGADPNKAADEKEGDKKLVRISKDCLRVAYKPDGVESDSPDETKATQNEEPSTKSDKQKKSTPGAISPSKSGDKIGTQCHVCTYSNTSNTGTCKVCGSSLDPLDTERYVSPGTLKPMHMLHRQKSVLTEELRQVDDEEALELWQHITFFCRQVINFLSFYMYN